MKSRLQHVFMCIFTLFSGQCSAFTMQSHGQPPIQSGFAIMGNGKLFGVSNGQLHERMYAGSSWHWINHGQPGSLQNGEKLKSTPCVVRDGKLFVITNYGNLIERFYQNGWKWVHHGKPAGTSLNTDKCMCTIGQYRDRVYVVGTNGEVYERVYTFDKSGSWKWMWKQHFSPSATKIKPGGIAIANSKWANRLYAVGLNGNLYELDITKSGIWHDDGRPSTEENILSVISRHGVFVTSSLNRVWKYEHSTFKSYPRPNAMYPTSPPMVLSTPLFYRDCQNAVMRGRTVLMITSGKRLYMLAVGLSSSSHYWLHVHTFRDGKEFAYNPELMIGTKCPKVFTVTKNGEVFEFFR